MIARNALGAIALATTCLATSAAFAQNAAPAVNLGPPGSFVPITGEVGMGLMGVAGTNPNQAGRYTGLNTTGLNLLGQFELGGRAPWDSGGTRYYELYGNNLVLQTGSNLGTGAGSDRSWQNSINNELANNGSLGFNAGDQGTWEAGTFFRSITYTGNVIDSLYTVNGSTAFLNNGLAPWGGATATSKGPVTSFTIPQLQATGAMQPFQTGTRRNIVGGDFSYIWGNWTFTGAFTHEHKEGSLEESFYEPYSGQAFAMPVDYDTNRYDAKAVYATRPFQGVFQFTFSQFNDNNTYVSLPFPISNTVPPFQRSAAYSLPPSNEAGYFTILLADNNLVPKTRLNLNARVGLEKQNDTFAPNTADPNPITSVGVLPGISGLNSMLQGTTANSLDDTATVYQVNVSANSNPIENLDTRVYYGIDGRNVSLNQYKVNVGSVGGSGTDTSAVGEAFVVPQDWLKQNAGAELEYRIIPEDNTRLTVGYKLLDIDRSNAQVGHSWTNTASVSLSSELGSQADGQISFDYIDRSGTISYLEPWENLLGTPNTTPYYSGAYYQAPMTSEVVKLMADYTPMQSLATDFFLQFKNENYTYDNVFPVGTATPTTIPLTGQGGGIKQDYAISLGPDLNWRPRDNINVHFFYTYELLFFNNLGNGACSTAAEAATSGCAGTAGYFQNKNSTVTNTFGLSADWKVTEKLKLKADYTFQFGSVMFDQFNGVFIPVTPKTQLLSYQNVSNYPDINSTMNSLRLTATYQLTPTIELGGQVAYYQYHDNNWYDTANAIQGSGTSAITTLTPGYPSPNYSIVTVLAGVRFKL